MPVTTIIKNATIFGFHPWPYWTEVQESLFTGFPCLQERTKKHRGKKMGKGGGIGLVSGVEDVDFGGFLFQTKICGGLKPKIGRRWPSWLICIHVYIYIYIYMFFIHISYIHICWGLFIYIYIHIYTEYIWVAQLQTRLVLKGWLFEMVISNLAT